MSNDKKYDLKERTALFGERAIIFCYSVKQTSISKPIMLQLVRSSTSIGANYREADCGETKKDFIHKLGICRKEASETQYWLRMVKLVAPESVKTITELEREATELSLIFSAVIRKTRAGM